MSPRWRTLIAVALAVLALDQWTKLLAVKHLTPAFVDAALTRASHAPVAVGRLDPEARDELLGAMSPLEQLRTFYTARAPCEGRVGACPPMRVFEGFWDWRYAENPGAAWSMFARASPRFRSVFLIGVSLGAVVFIILFFRKLQEHQRLLIFALSLVLGGAIGNLIDRVRLGYVVDFIEWYAGTHHWPTFNVADSAISSGIILLAVNMLFDLRPRKAAPQQGNRAKADTEVLASPHP